jgi:hypothetical protein
MQNWKDRMMIPTSSSEGKQLCQRGNFVNSLINGMDEAWLPVRADDSPLEFRGEEIYHTGHFEQGRDMRFNPIISLGLENHNLQKRCAVSHALIL